MSRRKPSSPVDEAFRGEIAELRRRHHEAWLAREPGDGMATDWVRENGVPVPDPETGQLVEVRVAPTFHAFNGSAAYQGSKCQGHRCP
jgi:hypothetical protein